MTTNYVVARTYCTDAHVAPGAKHIQYLQSTEFFLCIIFSHIEGKFTKYKNLKGVVQYFANTFICFSI